ncbi:UNVERIFIED_CONTAM: hypothetical protein GTU68_032879, partial [Idotea baltica]|nr:hypothetical protein [Idotea baltica]
SGPKNRQRFLCEVRVESFSYVGVGNSTNKKDAQTNAAKDFAQYLIRQDIINPNDCPSLQIPTLNQNVDTQSHSYSSSKIEPMLPVPGLKDEGNVYRPIQREGRPMSYMDRVEERRAMEEAEDVDLTANIHGNWTIDNAKARLNMFFQANKIKTDYSYKPVGPDHNRIEFLNHGNILAGTIFSTD